MNIPNITSGVKLAQPPTDWEAVSKTTVIELGFLITLGAIVTGHSTPDIVSLCLGAGATLGLMRIANIAANVINVRSYLTNPSAGVVPQSPNTPLVTTAAPISNGNGGATHAG